MQMSEKEFYMFQGIVLRISFQIFIFSVIGDVHAVLEINLGLLTIRLYMYSSIYNNRTSINKVMHDHIARAISAVPVAIVIMSQSLGETTSHNQS